jgi:hypothetical protein
MTNHWTDIGNANVILSMGGNSAEAHPVGFRWVMHAKKRSNARPDLRGPTLQPHYSGIGLSTAGFAPGRTSSSLAV